MSSIEEKRQKIKSLNYECAALVRKGLNNKPVLTRHAQLLFETHKIIIAVITQGIDENDSSIEIECRELISALVTRPIRQARQRYKNGFFEGVTHNEFQKIIPALVKYGLVEALDGVSFDFLPPTFKSAYTDWQESKNKEVSSDDNEEICEVQRLRRQLRILQNNQIDYLAAQGSLTHLSIAGALKTAKLGLQENKADLRKNTEDMQVQIIKIILQGWRDKNDTVILECESLVMIANTKFDAVAHFENKRILKRVFEKFNTKQTFDFFDAMSHHGYLDKFVGIGPEASLSADHILLSTGEENKILPQSVRLAYRQWRNRYITDAIKLTAPEAQTELEKTVAQFEKLLAHFEGQYKDHLINLSRSRLTGNLREIDRRFNRDMTLMESLRLKIVIMAYKEKSADLATRLETTFKDYATFVPTVVLSRMKKHQEHAYDQLNKNDRETFFAAFYESGHMQLLLDLPDKTNHALSTAMLRDMQKFADSVFMNKIASQLFDELVELGRNPEGLHIFDRDKNEAKIYFTTNEINEPVEIKVHIPLLQEKIGLDFDIPKIQTNDIVQDLLALHENERALPKIIPDEISRLKKLFKEMLELNDFILAPHKPEEVELNEATNRGKQIASDELIIKFMQLIDKKTEAEIIKDDRTDISGGKLRFDKNSHKYIVELLGVDSYEVEPLEKNGVLTDVALTIIDPNIHLGNLVGLLAGAELNRRRFKPEYFELMSEDGRFHLISKRENKIPLAFDLDNQGRPINFELPDIDISERFELNLFLLPANHDLPYLNGVTPDFFNKNNETDGTDLNLRLAFDDVYKPPAIDILTVIELENLLPDGESEIRENSLGIKRHFGEAVEPRMEERYSWVLDALRADGFQNRDMIIYRDKMLSEVDLRYHPYVIIEASKGDHYFQVAVCQTVGNATFIIKDPIDLRGDDRVSRAELLRRADVYKISCHNRSQYLTNIRHYAYSSELGEQVKTRTYWAKKIEPFLSAFAEHYTEFNSLPPTYDQTIVDMNNGERTTFRRMYHALYNQSILGLEDITTKELLETELQTNPVLGRLTEEPEARLIDAREAFTDAVLYIMDNDELPCDPDLAASLKQHKVIGLADMHVDPEIDSEIDLYAAWGLAIEVSNDNYGPAPPAVIKRFALLLG